MQVFIISDCLTNEGQGFVYKVVESLTTFINSLDWIGPIKSCVYSHYHPKSESPFNVIDYPVDDQVAKELKHFYMTFVDEAESKHIYKVELRNVY